VANPPQNENGVAILERLLARMTWQDTDQTVSCLGQGHRSGQTCRFRKKSSWRWRPPTARVMVRLWIRAVSTTSNIRLTNRLTSRSCSWGGSSVGSVLLGRSTNTWASGTPSSTEWPACSRRANWSLRSSLDRKLEMGVQTAGSRAKLRKHLREDIARRHPGSISRPNVSVQSR